MGEGRSFQQNVDFVEDLFKEHFNAYIAEKVKIPSWGSKIDQDVATYFTSIEE
jgi:hypothetical protein